MTPSDLARVLHVPKNRITEIINGRREITADTALRLGQYFGTGGEFWLNLQNNYDLRLAEQIVGKKNTGNYLSSYLNILTFSNG
jgi:antitoxin HigA-1